ncbi:MAG: FeoB-associated Cys-rich membrane protein [Clostridia bacterium]|nr:FeoB-associated Cys-rich membrane protein [Clostridia bacterium]
MARVIIIGILLGYCAFVIYRKVKNVKAGKFCDCGCSSCEAKCHKKEERKQD